MKIFSKIARGFQSSIFAECLPMFLIVLVLLVGVSFIPEQDSSEEKGGVHSENTTIINTSPLLTQNIFSDKALSSESSDKSLSAFIKNYPETDVADKYGVYGHIPYNEIWIRDNNSGKEKLLVKTGDVSNYSFANTNRFPFSAIYGLHLPIFSLDGNKLYFMSFAWTTSGAIFSVDISTGQLNFITDGNFVGVITMGSNKGNLIVRKHKYYGEPNYGSYDHYYIITETNEEIRDLGDNFNRGIFGISE
ncbi:hypothetical protein COV42_01335 [Candidatus Campbellbacteria bacterium CG11_big_fil_rev_8_21_14_0_20_44_21]|nr:MAG: hypothetical protein COV42_01335 [Candidatus Campbellbacteria bacterium CG11_big_fil_rev_8_21_14_0_20_44_21]